MNGCVGPPADSPNPILLGASSLYLKPFSPLWRIVGGAKHSKLLILALSPWWPAPILESFWSHCLRTKAIPFTQGIPRVLGTGCQEWDGSRGGAREERPIYIYIFLLSYIQQFFSCLAQLSSLISDFCRTISFPLEIHSLEAPIVHFCLQLNSVFRHLKRPLVHPVVATFTDVGLTFSQHFEDTNLLLSGVCYGCWEKPATDWIIGPL